MIKFGIAGYQTKIGDCHDGLVRYNYSYISVNGGESICENFGYDGYEGMLPEDFSDGVAVYKMLKDGAYKTSEEYFYNGENWDYYYVNTNGDFVLGPYEYADSFSEGRAVVCNERKYYCIDMDGNVIFPMEWYGNEDSFVRFSEGLMPYYDSNGKYGFVGYDGNVVIESKYDDVVKLFEDGIAVVMENGKYLYINMNGVTIFETDEFWCHTQYRYWMWMESLIMYMIKMAMCMNG